MTRYLILLFLIISFQSMSAQDKKDKWTIDNIMNTEFLRSASFSPDNSMVVWTKKRAVTKKDRYVSDIYLTRIGSKKDGKYRTVRLTNSDESDYGPFFSKDGEKIYFRSSRDKGNKLWSLNIYGGEPEKVHEFKNGLSGIQWIDSTTFAFTANEGKSLYSTEIKKKKDNTVVVEDSAHWEPSRLFSFSLKDKKIKRLTENSFPIQQYRISSGGKWLVYAVTRSLHFNTDAQPATHYFLKNMETGKTIRILDGLQTPYGFEFTKSNGGFYFVSTHSKDIKWAGAGAQFLYYFDLQKTIFQQVNLGWDNGLGGSFYVLGEDVLCNLANGATSKLEFYQKGAHRWIHQPVDLGPKDEHVAILTVSDDYQKILFEHSTASQLPVNYFATLKKDGANLQFTKEDTLLTLNKGLSKKPLVRSEIFKWKGYQGEEVNGILYYPENYEAGKRYPLMLSIHGGPAGVTKDAWRERWSTYPQIIAQRGAFVLKPNYHGSSNHGQKFVESIKHNYYTPELDDITKGIEALNQKGMIDMDQLGTMGWSNGAILTTMLTVRYPDMFKVACPGAGDVNWTSDYGTCAFGVSFDQSYFGGAPWDDVDGKTYNEAYIKYSPLFELEKVKTPTIIFHGSNDRAVPRDQGWEYYRALQQSGNAPVRFLWFPGQPHGLQKITHRKRKMEEELKWIDTYLFKTTKPKNEAFKADSPLAKLIERDTFGYVNGMAGISFNKRIIPEVVAIKKDSLYIGRFEVTNAQYRQFNKRFPYSTGQDNYPAVVSRKQANRYIIWLNKLTKHKYRLPNKKEAAKWHKKANKVAAKENTLRYWAGYDMTINDLPVFQEKLEGLKTSLILPIGQFSSTKIGNASVFDLGGNVAEYAQDGKVYGFSAYEYVDGKATVEVKDKGKFVGFRVVRVR